VAGHDVIVLDDEISRGTTVFELLDRLRDEGARSRRVACTHGLFADTRWRSWPPPRDEIVCTNTARWRRAPQLTILSVAPASPSHSAVSTTASRSARCST